MHEYLVKETVASVKSWLF